MKILARDVMAIVQKAPPGLSNATLIKHIRNTYCPLMERKGMCSSVCANCAPNILNITEEFQNVKPNIPAAWLIYCIRTIVAHLSEETAPLPTAEVSMDNPFEQLFKEIHESTTT